MQHAVPNLDIVVLVEMIFCGRLRIHMPIHTEVGKTQVDDIYVMPLFFFKKKTSNAKFYVLSSLKKTMRYICLTFNEEMLVCSEWWHKTHYAVYRNAVHQKSTRTLIPHCMLEWSSGHICGFLSYVDACTRTKSMMSTLPRIECMYCADKKWITLWELR